MVAIKRQESEVLTAINNLKWIVKQDPENFEALTQLAILRLLDFEDLKAMRLLRVALKINPNFIPALVTSAEVMRLAGDLEKAKTLYKKVLTGDSEQLFAIKGLAKACLATGSHDESFNYFEEAC